MRRNWTCSILGIDLYMPHPLLPGGLMILGEFASWRKPQWYILLGLLQWQKTCLYVQIHCRSKSEGFCICVQALVSYCNYSEQNWILAYCIFMPIVYFLMYNVLYRFYFYCFVSISILVVVGDLNIVLSTNPLLYFTYGNFLVLYFFPF